MGRTRGRGLEGEVAAGRATAGEVCCWEAVVRSGNGRVWEGISVGDGKGDCGER